MSTTGKCAMFESAVVVTGATTGNPAVHAIATRRRRAVGRGARLSRTLGPMLLGILAVSAWAQPAQAQQSLVLNLGHFALRGADARIEDDVLLENLNVFAFDLEDFNNGTVGAEWLVGLGEYFDAGFGVGYYRQTVPSVYFDFVDENGFEIEQDFRLRITPLTATIRVHPFGRDPAVAPYLGVGVGAFSWRYSEVGAFIDFNSFDVFRDRFVASGTDVGGVLFGGVRFPFGDRFAAGIELRYTEANGRVGIDEGFLDERIDLGGLATSFTFQVGF